MIAFDLSAKRTGIARLHNGSWRVTSDPFEVAWIASHVQAMAHLGHTRAAIELPSLCARNPKVYGTLMRLVGAVEALCKLNGIEVVLVPAKTWQASWGIAGLPRAAGKRRSIEIAKRLGVDVANDDESDAVLLGEYARCQMEREGRAK